LLGWFGELGGLCVRVTPAELSLQADVEAGPAHTHVSGYASTSRIGRQSNSSFGCERRHAVSGQGRRRRL